MIIPHRGHLIWDFEAAAYTLQKQLLEIHRCAREYEPGQQARPSTLSRGVRKGWQTAYTLSMSGKSVEISAPRPRRRNILRDHFFLQLASKAKGQPIACWNIKDARTGGGALCWTNQDIFRQRRSEEG